MKILVTGGAGYIGSHTCLSLLREDHEILVVDNFKNSNVEAIKRVYRLADNSGEWAHCDTRNYSKLLEVFEYFRPEAVIHFAGLKSVSESVENPSVYYSVNVGGTATLLEVMNKVDCLKIIFSSSATVYGRPNYLPYDEDHPTLPINPYGRTKLMCEHLLRDWVNSDQNHHAVCLRYFNPVGADRSGKIGEDPNDTPTNLMPYISQVAAGRLSKLSIFGNDYPTSDGTCRRDYIHVSDLADAHVRALEKIMTLDNFEVINVGLGYPQSVLELTQAFEKISGQVIPYEFGARRTGDLAEFWSDITKIKNKLHWRPKYNINDICLDAWNWQRKNPKGYRSE